MPIEQLGTTRLDSCMSCSLLFRGQYREPNTPLPSICPGIKRRKLENTIDNVRADRRTGTKYSYVFN